VPETKFEQDSQCIPDTVSKKKIISGKFDI